MLEKAFRIKRMVRLTAFFALTIALATPALADEQDTAKLLKRLAKSVERQQFADAKITGATIEGRAVVIQVEVFPAADPTEILQGLKGGMEKGMCQRTAVDFLEREQISYRLNITQNAKVLGVSSITADSCRELHRILANNDDSVPIKDDAEAFFDFKGIVAGSNINLLETMEKCSKAFSEPVNTCYLPDGKVAGEEVFPSLVIYKNRLSSLKFRVPAYSYARIKASLIAKYGKPLGEENVSWQNKMGATFQNVHTYWDFRSGTMRLEQRSETLDEGSVLYVDLYQPPGAEPVVDF